MQTARGTPLTGSTDGRGSTDADAADDGDSTHDAGDVAVTADTDGAVGADAGRAAAPRRRRLVLLGALATAVLGLDQVTKAVALLELRGRDPIQLVDGVLSLRLVLNPGAAFGIGAGYTVVFTAVMIIVSIVILRVARTLASSWWAVALGLLLGGALGNLTDRLFRAPAPFRGHVIDFLELPNWPVFNLADSAIVTAGALMIALTVRGVGLDGSRHGGGDGRGTDQATGRAPSGVPADDSTSGAADDSTRD